MNRTRGPAIRQCFLWLLPPTSELPHPTSSRGRVMPDYIPRADADFDSWQANFVTYANANLAALGLVAGDLVPIAGGQTGWTTAYTAHIAAQATAQSATALKETARQTYVFLLRALVKRLQASPAVNDAERGALGITIPDPTALDSRLRQKERAALGESSESASRSSCAASGRSSRNAPFAWPESASGIPRSRRVQRAGVTLLTERVQRGGEPDADSGRSCCRNSDDHHRSEECTHRKSRFSSRIPHERSRVSRVTVECARLRHVIAFRDESKTGRGKPEGALGAEIWMKIGPTPPVDPGELAFVALDTKSPYTLEFAGADGGKLAHYMLRWVTGTGLKGPWSETASITIGQ